MARKPENETTDEMLQEPTDAAGITETQPEVQEVLQVNAQDNEQANAQDNAQAVSEEPAQTEFTPRAVFVRLRDMHPHDSYGRAGYRFSKTDEVEILVSDLTDEQVLALNDDPWLECHFAV